MIKFGFLFLLYFLYFTTTLANVPDDCLQCICKVESGCRKVGCHDDRRSPSCGYYQIKKDYYEDCGQPGKLPFETIDSAWRRCADDKTCAEKCVNAYLRKYATSCNTNPTCEMYARVHNGGPQGCKSSSTIGYWNKVKKCLDNK